jgi:hypothetical protein
MESEGQLKTGQIMQEKVLSNSKDATKSKSNCLL